VRHPAVSPTLRQSNRPALFGQPIRPVVSINKQTKTRAEFEQFARDKGHKVENGVVIFEKNVAAARLFHEQAQEAGFAVVLEPVQAESLSMIDSISKLPKDYVVMLAP